VSFSRRRSPFEAASEQRRTRLAVAPSRNTAASVSEIVPPLNTWRPLRNTAGRRTRCRALSLVAAAGVGAAIVGLVTWIVAPGPTPALVRRFTIPIPASVPLSTTIGYLIALSPDGRTLVYTSGNPPGLMKRQIDGLSFERVRGAEVGTVPFFSPDSAWIGFYAEGKLKKVPVDGGLDLDQNFADYDVAPDGRFLAIRRDNAGTDEIHIVLNWTEELGAPWVDRRPGRHQPERIAPSASV